MGERSTEQASPKRHQAAVPSSNEEAIRLIEAWAKESSADDDEFWDQFEVCTVEEVDGELRLGYYTLKYIKVGPDWKPLREWYVLHRTVGLRILPENVDK